MVSIDSAEELSSQVTSRATRAGLWMSLGAVAMFVAGVMTGRAMDRRLMGGPVQVATVPPAPNEVQTPPAAKVQKDVPDVKTPEWLKHEYEPGSPEMLDHVTKRVKQILRLDEGQGQQVRAIIEKYNPRMEVLRRRFEPELRKLAIDAVSDLWPILRVEQRNRLTRILGRGGRWLIEATSRPARPTSAPSQATGPGES
jgi:hypothetical protein